MYFWVYLNLGTTVGCRNSECQLVTPTRIKQSVVFHVFWTYSFFLLSSVQPPSRRLLFLGVTLPNILGIIIIHEMQFDTIHDGFSRDSRVTHHQKILSSIPSENSINQPVPVEGAVKNQYGQSSDCSWCDWWLSNSINPIIFQSLDWFKEQIQESPIFNAKIYGVRFRFSPEKSNSLNQWFELVMVLRHFAHLFLLNLEVVATPRPC